MAPAPVEPRSQPAWLDVLTLAAAAASLVQLARESRQRRRMHQATTRLLVRSLQDLEHTERARMIARESRTHRIPWWLAVGRRVPTGDTIVQVSAWNSGSQGYYLASDGGTQYEVSDGKIEVLDEPAPAEDREP